MAELNALTKVIKMIVWNMRRIHPRTYSPTTHRWMSGALPGRACLKTSAKVELWILRRIGMITWLFAEYNLQMDIVHTCPVS